MFIKDYTTKDYPIFQDSDSIEYAYEIAKDFGYSHIFVEKNGFYAGAISLNFLENNPDGELGSLEIHYEKFAIIEDNNLLETIKIFHIFNTNIVPVIAKTENYLGYISADDVFCELSKSPLFSENGAMLIVETNSPHYSFTEIAQIVEGNNSKIYGCYISNFLKDSVQITLKINSEHLASVAATFERFGYHIINKYYNDENEDLLKDRFGFFQKYLEF